MLLGIDSETVVNHKPTGSPVTRIVLVAGNVAVGNVAGMALLALFMLVVARRLSLSEFGLFGSLYAFALLSTDLADLGTGAHLIVTSNGKTAEQIVREVDALMLGRLLIHIIIGMAFVVIGWRLNVIEAGWAVATLAFFFSVRVLIQAEARARQQYWRSSFLIVGERAVALILLLVTGASNLAAVFVCMALGSVAACSPRLVGWRFHGANLRGLRSVHARARHFGLSSLSSDLLGLDVPLIAAIAGSAAAGLYTIPSRLLLPMAIIGSALSAVLMRELPALDPKEVRISVKRVLKMSLGGVAILAASVAIASNWLLVPFLGVSYAPAVTLVQVAALTATVTAGCSVLQAALQSMRQDKQVSSVVAVAGVAYVVAVSVGAALFGPIGAVIGGCIVQISQFGVLMRRWNAWSARAAVRKTSL
jgi:O-antigen/teichoic acid export membrane protein